ncbi:MAG: hypothetical protein ACTHJ6_02175 [Oryzihumus sp.]
MTDLPTPTASRLQQPSWRDSRLIVGVLLVLVATALGARVVAAADDTVPMYAAAATLVPGEPVTQDDVRVVRVRLAPGDAAYLPADHDLSGDHYVLREVRPGELVPRSALGGRGDVGVKPLTVSVSSDAATGLVQGSVVDVWVSPRDPAAATERYLDPQRLVESASVARTPHRASGLSGPGGSTGVEVLVPDGDVQDLIAAIDTRARVTLVPVPGSVRAGQS